MTWAETLPVVVVVAACCSLGVSAPVGIPLKWSC